MLQLVSFLMRHSKSIVLLAIGAGVVSGACSAALIAVVHAVLNRGSAQSEALLMAFGILCILSPISRVVSQTILIRIAQKAVRDIRIDLSRQIAAAPLRSLEEMGSHRLLAALTDDVMWISAGLVGIPTLCLQAAVVLGGLIYLNWLSWKVFLIIFACLVVGAVTVQIGIRIGIRYLTLCRSQEDAVFKHVRALLDGAKELKLHHFRRKAFLSDVLDSEAAAVQRLSVKGNTIVSAAITWANFMLFVLLGVLLFVVPGTMSVSPEALTGYTVTMLYLLVPLDVIGSILPTLGRASVSIKNVKSLGLPLASVAENDNLEKTVSNNQWKGLELSGTTHSYFREQENSSFVLGPLDFVLKPGEVVFLIGGNGSGKTTFAKLLTGLYMPEKGEVLLDDEVITDDKREYYRQHFSAVFSDFHLFESLLGLSRVDLQSKAESYLQRLQLTHKVQIKDGVLSTIDLSQGQRKRLALLVAYLEDRPVCVFDEWAADQDPQFKDVFYLDLIPELKARGKAVLVISHDDRYFHLADRLIKLEDGKLLHRDVQLPSIDVQEIGAVALAAE